MGNDSDLLRQVRLALNLAHRTDDNLRVGWNVSILLNCQITDVAVRR